MELIGLMVLNTFNGFNSFDGVNRIVGVNCFDEVNKIDVDDLIYEVN